MLENVAPPPAPAPVPGETGVDPATLALLVLPALELIEPAALPPRTQGRTVGRPPLSPSGSLSEKPPPYWFGTLCALAEMLLAATLKAPAIKASLQFLIAPPLISAEEFCPPHNVKFAAVMRHRLKRLVAIRVSAPPISWMQERGTGLSKRYVLTSSQIEKVADYRWRRARAKLFEA